MDRQRQRQRQLHRQDHQPHRRDHNPSFSSTLLDAIYNSIDEGEGPRARFRKNDVVLYTQSMRMIQEENIVDKKVSVRRKSMPEFDRRSRNVINHSSSGSSDSGAWFSSSESTSYSRPKHSHDQIKPSSVKTKSRTLKNIYGDLKKVKQPISPGGRLASFLNSIFTAGNPKKAKTDASTCSSASSYSRSCLSKTQTPTTTSSSSKRSVRFCLHEDGPIPTTNLNPSEDLKSRHVSEEKRRVQEAARDLLKTYRQIQNETLNFLDEVEDVDDYDDDASCASSDLFELDNLSAIGVDRYGEELPVYETTHLGTNRAIANGLIV